MAAQAYGIDLLQVQEIRTYQPPVRIVGAPESVAGVLNLRGVVVPVVDLRRIVGGASRTAERGTVIVILTIGDDVIGIVVDGVSDVVVVPTGQIESLPELPTTASRRLLGGIAKVDDRLLLLVDPAGIQAALAGAAG